jgi:flagellin-specific chaperone FliS
MLTGGEKYNTKQIIIKISEIYPKIKDIISNEKYVNNNANLTSLYNYTLEIFTNLYSLSTTNILNSSPAIAETFNLLQQVHCYKSVNNSNKQALIDVVNKIPQLQEELIKLVESDTTNRDAVLRQIMDELGIVDPNAKKKRSLW